MNGDLPALSVVVVTYRDWAGFRLLLDRLAEQTAAAALEVVVVAPSPKDLGRAVPDRFWGSQVVEMGARQSPGAAKAAGVEAARAPLVAFTEDHSFPRPAWAAALIEAHQSGEYAAAGPVMRNANPSTAASWGTFLVFYAFALGGTRACEVESVPGNQSCYRRELLLAYGVGLARELESETTLQWDLRSKGHRLLQVPDAQVDHMNFSRLRPPALEYFHSSRLFAAGRSATWGVLRRLCYAAGSPLIPVVRVPRVLGDARRGGVPAGTLLRALPAALWILASGALGEMAGYAAGPGRAAQGLAGFENRRHLWFRQSDLEEAARR